MTEAARYDAFEGDDAVRIPPRPYLVKHPDSTPAAPHEHGREAARDAVAGDFREFAHRQGIPLDDLQPSQRRLTASGIIEYTYATVDDAQESVVSGITVPRRVVEQTLRDYYSEFAPDSRDRTLNQRRYEHLQKYGTLALRFNKLGRYSDLALVASLERGQTGQARVAAQEVLAAYGAHFAVIARGVLHRNNAVMIDQPQPRTRAGVIRDLGPINDED